MTGPPHARPSRDDTRAGRLALSLSLALACAAPAPPAAQLAADAPPPPGALRVRLAFGADADLDLYVTDPLQETVYFANTPSASGGALAGDVRCDAPPARVETVLFPAALPGRYRVGVDFPVRCRRRAGRAAFAVVLETRDGRWERRGEVAFGQFLPIVLEVDVGAGP